MPNEQMSYYLRREQDALQLAQAAREPSIRRIHLEMAVRYADLAAHARDRTGRVAES